MDKEELRRRLLATFLGELEEYLQSLNRDLLALEEAGDEGGRGERLRGLLRTAHSLKGASRAVGLKIIEQACHAMEEVLAKVQGGAFVLDRDGFGALFSTVDAMEAVGEAARRGAPIDPLAEAFVPLERLLAAAGAAAAATAAKLAAAPEDDEEEEAAASSEAASPGVDASSVRVDARRLDALLSQSSTLLITEHRVHEWTERLSALHALLLRWSGEWRNAERGLKPLLDPGSAGRLEVPLAALQSLSRVGENLRSIEREVDFLVRSAAEDARSLSQSVAALDDEVHRARMRPFREASQGLPRAARDVARHSDKDVEVRLLGEDVLVDRSILERLRDPLLHLVRNAVDHGVEPPAEREAVGKPRRGVVTVQASVRGARVEVVVADDGRGLDVDALRKSAERKRIPVPKSDAEVAQLIFRPGFSTARMITDVSGRGVGLDVVRSQVEALHGQLQLDFTKGQGTRFVLTFPLTLTTLRALLVRAAGQVFVFPADHVDQLKKLAPESLRSVEGSEVILLDGEPVRVVSLAGVLGLPDVGTARRGRSPPVVVVRTANARAAFVVDELLHEQEVVIKGLGRRLRRLRNVAGATLLGDGRVALILNASELITAALERRELSSGAGDDEERGRKRHIIVVDDSVTTRSMEKNLLEAAGYEVTVAVDGADAWERLTELGADLVVTDAEMPRMDGFQLTQRIRGSARFCDVPVILMTALGSDRDRARGLEVGASAYLVKGDVAQSNLLDVIARLL